MSNPPPFLYTVEKKANPQHYRMLAFVASAVATDDSRGLEGLMFAQTGAGEDHRTELVGTNGASMHRVSFPSMQMQFLAKALHELDPEYGLLCIANSSSVKIRSTPSRRPHPRYGTVEAILSGGESGDSTTTYKAYQPAFTSKNPKASQEFFRHAERLTMEARALVNLRLLAPLALDSKASACIPWRVRWKAEPADSEQFLTRPLYFDFEGALGVEYDAAVMPMFANDKSFLSTLP